MKSQTRNIIHKKTPMFWRICRQILIRPCQYLGPKVYTIMLAQHSLKYFHSAVCNEILGLPWNVPCYAFFILQPKLWTTNRWSNHHSLLLRIFRWAIQELKNDHPRPCQSWKWAFSQITLNLEVCVTILKCLATNHVIASHSVWWHSFLTKKFSAFLKMHYFL